MWWNTSHEECHGEEQNSILQDVVDAVGILTVTCCWVFLLTRCWGPIF